MSITRREFYAAAGGMVAAAALENALQAAEKSGQRLNILWLMTDQHTYSVMGCAGNPVAKTPNLDALAAAGARFTQATCVTPFCAASSVDLMPTLLDYAAAPVPPGVQGRSLRPYIERKKEDVFDAAFCERGLGQRFGRMARTAEAKYCYYSGGRRELFDLARDPYEMKNLVEDPQYRALRGKMHSLLLKQALETADPVAKTIPKE